MAALSGLVASAGLAPQDVSWTPELLGLHVASDGLIAASYYSLPVALAVFLARRREVAVGRVPWAFAVFIMACGTTHLFDIIVLWRPLYWVQATFKAITALTSVLTAIGLWPLVPEAMSLRAANARLREQIEQRDGAVAALKRETAERLRTEAMLRQSQKMEAVGQLTGGLAHDFNNLLMVVQGNLEALEARIPDDDPRRRYVDRALNGAARGATLTHQLLAFSRRQTLQPVMFDPNERITGMSALLRGTIGTSADLELILAERIWPVEADPNQLETALLNLAINARDAMPEGGRLTIQTANVPGSELVGAGEGEIEPGEYVRIAVVDTGIGMPASVRDAAFEPFFTTKPVGQGSGLGLSQVFGFVKQSRGHVTLASEPGQGTTATIYLPKAAP